MRLSTKARYAVMAMVDLARQWPLNKEMDPVSLSGIAVRQDLPLPYLEQLFQKLKRAGLVTSCRGAAGGYVLSRSPDQMRIYDIVVAVDLQFQVTRCDKTNPMISEEMDASKTFSKSCQNKASKCLTHDLWDELSQVMELFFQRITLEDVCQNRVQGKGRLCFGLPTVCPSPESNYLMERIAR